MNEKKPTWLWVEEVETQSSHQTHSQHSESHWEGLSPELLLEEQSIGNPHLPPQLLKPIPER